MHDEMRVMVLCGYSAGPGQRFRLFLASICCRGPNKSSGALETRFSDKPPAAIVGEALSCRLAFNNKHSSRHPI